MYGINLIAVGKILGTVLLSNAVLSRNGMIFSICQQIIKYSAQNNIEMVKVMIRTLAQQHESAYNEVLTILQKEFTTEELQEIL